jgi:hypothetical protein
VPFLCLSCGCIASGVESFFVVLACLMDVLAIFFFFISLYGETRERERRERGVAWRGVVWYISNTCMNDTLCTYVPIYLPTSVAIDVAVTCLVLKRGCGCVKETMENVGLSPIHPTKLVLIIPRHFLNPGKWTVGSA